MTRVECHDQITAQRAEATERQRCENSVLKKLLVAGWPARTLRAEPPLPLPPTRVTILAGPTTLFCETNPTGMKLCYLARKTGNGYWPVMVSTQGNNFLLEKFIRSSSNSVALSVRRESAGMAGYTQ